jgi:indolepyruvate ferredoxin oxidoreductase
VDEQAVRAVIGARVEKRPETLDEIITRRAEFLTRYQDAAYAESYRSFVIKVRAVSEPLARVVAKNLFRLMAYKDEYEVARLYTDGSFAEAVSRQFRGDYRLTFHLAPPIMGRKDPFTGKPLKTQFGPWMMTGFRLLAKLKRLRGTGLDIFARNPERRLERQLIADYRIQIEGLIADPYRAQSPAALELAALPDMMRGFGHVKEANVAKASLREKELMDMLAASAPARKAAE